MNKPSTNQKIELVRDAYTGIKEDKTEKGKVFKGFRIRFTLALIVFAAFVYCDRKNITYANHSTDSFYKHAMESIDITYLLDLLK